MKSIANIVRDAELSPCGTYRYWLSRTWDATKPILLFCMLNPSTADAEKDDATIRVCMGRARLLGYGGIIVVNLFAFRATDPTVMKAAADPVGPHNVELIIDLARQYKHMICAWGDDGEFRQQAGHIRACLINLDDLNWGISLWHLGVTRKRNPKHPLRIAYSVQPELWHCVGPKPKTLKVEGDSHGSNRSKGETGAKAGVAGTRIRRVRNVVGVRRRGD